MSSLRIAIIGAACRLPKAPGLDALAALLFAGRDGVGEVPPERWARGLFYHPAAGQPGKAYTLAAGCIDAVDRFDPAFFGISAREAAHIDPQQRLLLELAYEAMEDAGVSAARLAGQKIGVFVGGSSWDYSTISAADLDGTDSYSMQGAALSSMSNRLSYQFDLRGPSLTVDTACSSSLVALHLACEALRRAEIPAALVGGVNLLLAPHPFVGFARASMLSRLGRCHAFDARADGYVRAEGGGAVLLKPLRAALADGDPIRAVILASGVNSDGHTNGFSVPSTQAQERLLREVHARAGIRPDDVSYFEAHGTGTPVGDPLEANAIGRAVGQYRRTRLPIGSVKSNIGHLEAASGMAGLMKLIAALGRREIPASLHFETPNPHIPFASLNLEVVTAPRPMIAGAAGFVAGLNSFGFGGTNAHIVLAAPSEPRVAKPRAETAGARPAALARVLRARSLPPLLLSARAPAALQTLAQDWQHILTSQPAETLAPLLRGAARLRDHYPHRLAIPGASAAAMAASLGVWLEQGPKSAGAAGADGAGSAEAGHAVSGKLAFVFSGNGSQWPCMASDAIAHSAPFRQMLGAVDAVLTPMLGWSVKARFRRPVTAEELRNTAIAQPMLFAVQLGCVAALAGHGIVADAHVGHSVGEVAAAWASGALDLTQAARVIVARSVAQQTRHGAGRMAVLGLSAEAAETAIAHLSPGHTSSGLTIAAVNSARSVTIAGHEPALARLRLHAEAMGWNYIALDLDYAFHSALMDPIRDQVIGGLAGLAPTVPATMLVSTVTGRQVTEPAMDADYWWRNVREPVRFSAAVEALIDAGVHQFVEIGPLPVLQSYLREAVTRSAIPGRVLGTLTRSQAATDPFAAIAARGYVAGIRLAGAPVFKGPATPRGLPRYPWQRERFWHERTAEAHEIIAPVHDHPLLGYRQAATSRNWFSHPSTATDPWLQDHVVDGAAVMPAAGMIEMALAAGRAMYPDAASLELRDLEISRTLPLEPGAAREVTLRIGGGGGFTIASRVRLSGDVPTAHATGQVLRGTDMPSLFSPPASTQAESEIAAAAIYQAAAALRLTYGPAFRTVRRVLASGSTQAVVELDDRGADRVADGYLIDPALVDGALQGLIGLAATQAFGSERTAVLPWRFGRVRLLRTDGARPMRALLHLRRRGARSLLADIALLDADGAIVMELLECWFAAIALGAAADPAERMVWTALVPSRTQQAGAVADLLDPALAGIAAAGTVPETALLADAMLTLAARDTAEALLHAGERPLAPGTERLFAQMQDWLERDGMASRDGLGWRISPATDLPAWQDVWRGLLFDVPAAAAETALAGAMAGSLGAILASGPQVAPALAGTLVDQMLFASPTGAGAIDALVACVDAWLDHWPAGRPLRVAEIGVGWPSLTRRLLVLFARRVPALRYVALAANEDALAAVADTLAGWPGVTGRIWDRGDHHEFFDLVLGLYPFTAPRAERATPAEATRLLAPDGHLLAIEATPSRLWQRIFTAEPGAPESWQAELEAAGCGRTRGIVLAGGQLWQAALIGAWRGREDAAQTPVLRPDSTIFASRHDRVAQALAGADRCRTIQDFAALADRSARSALRGVPDGPEIVILLPLDPPGEAPVKALAARLAILASGLQAIAASGCARVWLVTRDTGAGAPTAAALLGLLRTLANEMPELECRLLRLDPALSAEAAAQRIAAELAAPDAEREVVWTEAGRFVRRLRRGLPPADRNPAGATRLTVGRPGLLGSLCWERFSPRTPGAGEVAIAVQAAGLNFRDLMWAQGLLPEEALMAGFSGPSFGLECAGVVTAVGPGVDDLVPGMRVIAVAPAALASEVVTLRRAVIPMPDDMAMAEGATIPVAFLTAVYALGHLANLAPGERVLIHGGLGSLGLAAIQYALHRGAVVYATAGSQLRRDLLRLLGVAGVFDSRSARFADEVMAATGGAGVDVVLNSLSGELMESGLRVLAPFGRFIEVGKRDLYGNTRVGLRPLRHNIAYFAVDADELAAQRPAIAASVFAEITALLADGRLRPLPYRSYGFEDVVDAFRQLQGSGHLGKIVLTPGRAIEPALSRLPPALPALPAFSVRADRCYVLSGAVGGFGLEAALFLARHGARHIALLGRRGTRMPGADMALERLGALGVDARIFACDVADEASLADTLACIRAEMPPIAGVIHAAMVLDDGWARDLDAGRFAAVLRPKLGGAEALDRLTRADPVELFVLFSSITTVLGNPGQANYVAANAAMEAIAERRRAEGLPALAVAWGPIGDAGYLTRAERVSETLERLLDNAHLSAADALEALPALLASGVTVCGLADLQWGGLARQLPGLRAPLLSEMPTDGRAETSGGAMRLLLTTLSPEEAAATVLRVLMDEIAAILRIDPARVDPDQVIAELGMDSLTSVELRTALEARLAMQIPISTLASGGTLRAMSASIARMSAAPAPAPGDEVVARIQRFEEADEAPRAEAAE